MTLAGCSRGDRLPESKIVTRLEFSRRVAIGLLWACGCGTTPIDAVVKVEASQTGTMGGSGGTASGASSGGAGNGGGGGGVSPAGASGAEASGGEADGGRASPSGGEAGSGDASGGEAGGGAMLPCDVPRAGRFTVLGEGGCVLRGDPITVFGSPAFSTEVSADCASTRAEWDLIPSVAGTFVLRSVDASTSLDVRMGGDSPGTPIIVYEPNSLDNQRFWLRPRGSDAYELAPRHAPFFCAEVRDDHLEIWPCDPEETAQTFRLALVNCP